MSGHGGERDDRTRSSIPGESSAGDGGARRARDGDPCAIVQQAPLNSPRPAVVATLSVGDVLNIALSDAMGRPVLEVHAPAGVAGALTHTGHLAIVDCIRKGHQYVAEVANRSGGIVTLQVRPA